MSVELNSKYKRIWDKNIFKNYKEINIFRDKLRIKPKTKIKYIIIFKVENLIIVSLIEKNIFYMYYCWKFSSKKLIITAMKTRIKTINIK